MGGVRFVDAVAAAHILRMAAMELPGQVRSAMELRNEGKDSRRRPAQQSCPSESASPNPQIWHEGEPN